MSDREAFSPRYAVTHLNTAEGLLIVEDQVVTFDPDTGAAIGDPPIGEIVRADPVISDEEDPPEPEVPLTFGELFIRLVQSLAMEIPDTGDRVQAIPFDVGDRTVSDRSEAYRSARTLTGSGNGNAFSTLDRFDRDGAAYIAFDDRSIVNGTIDFAFHKSYQSRPNFTYTGTVSSIDGFSSEPTLSHTGTVTSGAGFTSEVKGTNAASLVSHYRHVYVLDNTDYAGSFTNQYGLYVAALTAGENNWGVWIHNNKSHFGGDVDLNGNLLFNVIGKGLHIKGGAAHAKAGNATLVAGTVTVTNTTVTANTVIVLCRKTFGGTTGNLSYTISPGASFTINSTAGSDTSVVSYFLIELIP